MPRKRRFFLLLTLTLGSVANALSESSKAAQSHFVFVLFEQLSKTLHLDVTPQVTSVKSNVTRYN
jgi:hypothetical protein